jgi:hypothetical protein
MTRKLEAAKRVNGLSDLFDFVRHRVVKRTRLVSVAAEVFAQARDEMPQPDQKQG